VLLELEAVEAMDVLDWVRLKFFKGWREDFLGVAVDCKSYVFGAGVIWMVYKEYRTYNCIQYGKSESW